MQIMIQRRFEMTEDKRSDVMLCRFRQSGSTSTPDALLGWRGYTHRSPQLFIAYNLLASVVKSMGVRQWHVQLQQQVQHIKAFQPS